MLVRLRQEVQALPRGISGVAAGPSGLTRDDARRRSALVAGAAVSGAVFLALAAVFWIGSNANQETGRVPDWTRLSELAGPRVLPVLTVVLVLALAAAGRRTAARFLLASVAGAGILMYALRIVLQAVGADDDGGRLSDFPSGHATATTALAGALVAIVWLGAESRAVRWLAAGLGVAAIVAVGWARVAGHDHTWLDVLGGVALGIVWLAICLLVVPPDRDRTFARKQVLWGAFALGASGFVFLGVLYPHEPLSTADWDVVTWFAAHRPAWSVSAGRYASTAGTVSAWVIGIGVPLILLTLRRFRDAVWAALTLAGIHLVTALLKDAFDRPRPHGGSAVPLPGSPSFPSGHASGSVVTFGVLAALAAERWPQRGILFWSLAVVLSLAVGGSRIVLGVHFTTDVLAGWCLGVAWLAGALLVRDALRQRPAASGA